MKNTATNDIIIRNVAKMNCDYVWTMQEVSYNGGADFQTTAEWKHLRDANSLKMADEWVSRSPVRIPFADWQPGVELVRA